MKMKRSATAGRVGQAGLATGKAILAAAVISGMAMIAVAGCAGPAQEAGEVAAVGDERLLVYTVNYPLQYFAERIGGDAVQVEFPAPAEGDPAYWRPDAEAITAYQEADVVLLNGAYYAKWVEMAPLPPSKLVDTSSAFADRYIEGATYTHSHGPGGDHEHGELAFTTWLDPTLAVAQARAIKEALAAARPDGANGFEEWFVALETELGELDGHILRLVDGQTDLPLLGSHPVYQYFARRYELNLQSVHFEPDEMPDEEAWQGLAHILEDHPAQWMLWEAEPLAEITARLGEMGIESVVYDPCGNRPASGDFLSIMQQNARNLERVFAE
jgi:zinc transport system substrate-binding protein